MMLLAEPAGRLLEHIGNCMPRGMAVHDRTRLIGQLRLLLNLAAPHGRLKRLSQRKAQIFPTRF
jgi:hypothetical protein